MPTYFPAFLAFKVTRQIHLVFSLLNNEEQNRMTCKSNFVHYDTMIYLWGKVCFFVSTTFFPLHNLGDQATHILPLKGTCSSPFAWRRDQHDDSIADTSTQ